MCALLGGLSGRSLTISVFIGENHIFLAFLRTNLVTKAYISHRHNKEGICPHFYQNSREAFIPTIYLEKNPTPGLLMIEDKCIRTQYFVIVIRFIHLYMHITRIHIHIHIHIHIQHIAGGPACPREVIGEFTV